MSSSNVLRSRVVNIIFNIFERGVRICFNEIR
jgi:hypothetical protein